VDPSRSRRRRQHAKVRVWAVSALLVGGLPDAELIPSVLPRSCTRQLRPSSAMTTSSGDPTTEQDATSRRTVET
jgi:hypothetical protein